MALQRGNFPSGRSDHRFSPKSSEKREMLNEEAFRHTITIERKRTERSKVPFLLMLLETDVRLPSDEAETPLARVASALLFSTRDTDVAGWYKDRAIVGVIYTGLPADERKSILSMILNRVSTTLRDELTTDQFNRIHITFHFFPDDWDHDRSGPRGDLTLYPDLTSRAESNRLVHTLKRAIDVVASGFILILLSPLLSAIALAIKASSKGPVFYRQNRIAQYGKQFTMLKFRSMYVNNDFSQHKEFVTKFIKNQAQPQPSGGNGDGVYKLTNDKRVTKLGRFLRKTSLDELPQLFNVLNGDMSLIGPRPPIPYELSVYQTWHRRRVLEVKPGITGLWQVTCRGRAKFDEMVRLDLEYARSWNLWLDFRILLRTPLAVIRGDGAC